jgi:hypothetical protein
MTVSSRALVEFILLGATHDRRQLQDSPILGDVWVEFAAHPAAPVDLLIAPYKTRPAGPVAALIASRVRKLAAARHPGEEAHVAYLQGIIAARLYFSELVCVVVPMTSWWKEQHVWDRLSKYEPGRLAGIIDTVLRWAAAEREDSRARLATSLGNVTALERYVALAGLILEAGRKREGSPPDSAEGGLVSGISNPETVLTGLLRAFETVRGEPVEGPPASDAQVWQVSLNRKAMPALERSVPAVKGDAARTLFKVKCEDIGWAVVDSGIDGSHLAFTDTKGVSRIARTFDFGNIRKIVSLDNLDETPGFAARVDELTAGRSLDKGAAARMLRALAEDANSDRPVNWELVEQFVSVAPGRAPDSGHGTHVAGIIGASGSVNGQHDGMCPDIKLYDFRVLGSSVEDTECAVIAALQYIRYLNDRHSYITVHGVNLSLSIPHDVRNFACGRTPVCNECERLVDSGVVVVAAAGNLGYQTFETSSGAYEGYAAFSITDPGNADGVITVGATHRFMPQTYGVSFFSSRGPTGDGRPKPDLVAPGERIRSCLPNGEWGELDGTSMAAPHVSGAAAMLLARYSELIGQPRRLKRILCESATDLGRERSFQGHGMLDVLRAFQKI